MKLGRYICQLLSWWPELLLQPSLLLILKGLYYKGMRSGNKKEKNEHDCSSHIRNRFSDDDVLTVTSGELHEVNIQAAQI